MVLSLEPEAMRKGLLLLLLLLLWLRMRPHCGIAAVIVSKCWSFTSTATSELSRGWSEAAIAEGILAERCKAASSALMRMSSTRSPVDDGSALGGERGVTGGIGGRAVVPGMVGREGNDDGCPSSTAALLSPLFSEVIMLSKPSLCSHSAVGLPSLCSEARRLSKPSLCCHSADFFPL
jgi:hypothetical protein